METMYERTRQLIGEKKLNKLKKSKVIVFGVGGVGGFAAEALARSGIGTLAVVDCDTVEETNINRQIIALQENLGRPKAAVMGERISRINSEAEARVFCLRLTQETVDAFALAEYDYIVDAIDDIPAKILLIETAKRLSVPIVSSMGTGNKLDPSKLSVADISKTHTCPLAKKVRKELSLRGIKQVKVVFSSELPNREEKTPAPASMVFVPGTAGLMLASQVICDLIFDE